MINEEKGNLIGSEDIPSTSTGSNSETTQSLATGSEDTNPTAPVDAETCQAVESVEEPANADGSPSSVDHEPRTDEAASSVAVKSVSVKEPQSFFGEQPLPIVEMAPRVLRYRTRRDLLLFSAGAVVAAAGAGFLLPKNTLSRLGMRRDMSSPRKEWLLNKALRIDDDVAEALYSANRMVPTYTKSQITPIKNNYNGATPDPGYISGWKLILEGLASGLSVSLDIRKLMNRFPMHEQITRLVCVEGWSAVA